MKLHLNDLGTLAKKSFKEWWEKDPLRQSATIAYYAVFSLPALLVIVVTVSGSIWGANAVNKHLFDQVTATMGAETAEQLRVMLEKAGAAKTSIWATIIGVFTLLLGATGVFTELQKTLNIIWEVEAAPGKGGIWSLVKTRILSFGLILSIAFLLLISLVVSTALSAMTKWTVADSSAFTLVIFHVLNFIVSLCIISILFALMFKFLPDAKIKWRHVWIGAFVTGLLFTLGKLGLAFYFGKAEPGSGYGAAGSVVLILLWVSYSSAILFLGAEFTRAYADLHSGAVAPVRHAEKVRLSKRAKEA